MKFLSIMKLAYIEKSWKSCILFLPLKLYVSLLHGPALEIIKKWFTAPIILSSIYPVVFDYIELLSVVNLTILKTEKHWKETKFHENFCEITVIFMWSKLD